MAYVAGYNQDDEDEEQQGGGASAPGIIQGSAAGTASGPAPGTGAGMAGGPGTDFTKSNFVSAKKIMDKNRGSAQADLTQPYRQQIGAAQQGLGSALDQYKQQTSGAAQQAKNLAGGVDKALSGDQESFSGIQNLLRGGVGVGQFEAPKAGVDEAGIQALGTQAGAASAMRQQAAKKGVTNYGAARSALDAALFASDPMARQRNQELQKMRMDYGAQTEEAGKTAAQKAAEAQAEIAKQQETVKSSLDTKSKEITDAATAAAEQAKQVTDRQRKDALVNNPQFQKYLNDQLAIHFGDDKKTKISVGDKLMNKEDFIRKTLDDLVSKYGSDYSRVQKTEGPLYNEDQANQFNTIRELLSDDTRVQAGNAPTIDSDVSGFLNKADAEISGASAKYDDTKSAIDKSRSSYDAVEKEASVGNIVPDFSAYEIDEKTGLGLKGSNKRLKEAYSIGVNKFIKNNLSEVKSGKSKDPELINAYKNPPPGISKDLSVKMVLRQRQIEKIDKYYRSRIGTKGYSQKDHKKAIEQVMEMFT